MIDAGILENDVLVCRSTKEARNGQIVVAVVNGEATVKTFSQQKNRLSYFLLIKTTHLLSSMKTLKTLKL